MSMHVIALDFNHAPLDVRGKAALKDEARLGELVSKMEEKVWLSTCNRVELYFVGETTGEDIIRLWLELADLPQDCRDRFVHLEGEHALRHLFRVASSLESMVVGETQIVGQVKKAYEDSVSRNWVGPSLHKVFQRAFRVAKKVRSQTEVGRLAVSIPSLGVKLAEKIVGDLSSRSILILGLGEMGRLSAEHFGSIQPRQLALYNRTQSNAKTLAENLLSQGIAATVVDDFSSSVLKSDVVVMAADADLISEADLLKRDSSGQIFFVLDLSAPARVPRISLSNGFIYGIDDLQNLAKENHVLRRQELVKAEEMIEDEIQKAVRSSEVRSVKETLHELSQKTSQITEEELKKLKARLPHLKDSDWKEIETMAKRLGAKVLQDPMVELKSRAKEDSETESVLAFFRSLFRI